MVGPPSCEGNYAAVDDVYVCPVRLVIKVVLGVDGRPRVTKVLSPREDQHTRR